MSKQSNRGSAGKAFSERIEDILAIERLDTKVLGMLTEDEQSEFRKALNTRLEQLDKEYMRLSQIAGETAQLSVNRVHWESNHQKIVRAIYASLAKTGQMPSQTYVAEVTGLSRKTVHQHMANGQSKTFYAEQLEHFNMMAPRVLGKVAQAAVVGNDMRAAKLYFEIAEKLNGQQESPPTNEQHFIKVNDTVISQEVVSRLSAEQLRQIEEIIAQGAEQNAPNSIEQPVEVISAPEPKRKEVKAPKLKPLKQPKPEKNKKASNTDSIKKPVEKIQSSPPVQEKVKPPEPVKEEGTDIIDWKAIAEQPRQEVATRKVRDIPMEEVRMKWRG